MATKTLQKTESFTEFAQPLVESRRFQDVDAVLVAAMDALSREIRDEEAQLAYVRRAVDEGDASGVCTGNPFADVRHEMGWTS
jgi:Arc/MetJ-type ribon-helix-helix transcriptional regulator